VLAVTRFHVLDGAAESATAADSAAVADSAAGSVGEDGDATGENDVRSGMGIIPHGLVRIGAPDVPRRGGHGIAGAAVARAKVRRRERRFRARLGMRTGVRREEGTATDSMVGTRRGLGDCRHGTGEYRG